MNSRVEMETNFESRIGFEVASFQDSTFGWWKKPKALPWAIDLCPVGARLRHAEIVDDGECELLADGGVAFRGAVGGIPRSLEAGGEGVRVAVQRSPVVAHQAPEGVVAGAGHAFGFEDEGAGDAAPGGGEEAGEVFLAELGHDLG